MPVLFDPQPVVPTPCSLWDEGHELRRTLPASRDHDGITATNRDWLRSEGFALAAVRRCQRGLAWARLLRSPRLDWPGEKAGEVTFDPDSTPQ